MNIVMARCPKCVKIEPHNTDGTVKEENERKFQTITCSVCQTSTKVYMGNHGEQFQENYEIDDDTTLL